MARAINWNQKAADIYYSNNSPSHATSYLWPPGYTHTQKHIRESDFNKPGVRLACLV